LEQPKERHTTDVKFYCMCAQRATHNWFMCQVIATPDIINFLYRT
jgi:hypothetical protein